MNLEKIKGRVSYIVFSNPESTFTIAKLKTETFTITLSCNFNLQKNEFITCLGQTIIHPRFGKQFKAKEVIRAIPNNKKDVESYFLNFEGIGPVRAKKIADILGKSAFDVIKNHEQFSKLTSVPLRVVESIAQKLSGKEHTEELVSFFRKYGVSLRHIDKVVRSFGESALCLILKNPYILDEIGVLNNFNKIEKISKDMKIEKDFLPRTQSGIKNVLYLAASAGHVFLSREELLKNTQKLCEVKEERIEEALENLISTGIIVVGEKSVIYLRELFEAEETAAAKISEFLLKDSKNRKSAQIYQLIKELKDSNNQYNDAQKQAVISVFTNSISIITGGPGTGKSSAVRLIVQICKRYGYKIILTSPTGRAAQRLSEICHKEAVTLHRLLKIKETMEDEQTFDIVNFESEIDCDFLIIDESSMVDIILMSNLLKCINKCNILLIGDGNQLPPIGPGNVFCDMLNSGVIETVHFDQIWRQKNTSSIPENAHRINSGQEPIFNDRDFIFIKASDTDSAILSISDVVNKTALKNHIESDFGIQVISPTKNGKLGTGNLNVEIRNKINSKTINKNEIFIGERFFRECDKVIQCKNNYDIEWVDVFGNKGLGIFNGDMGIIELIDPVNSRVRINFSGKIVTSTKSLLNNIELSYAITVHKSQGSEFDCIAMPVFDFLSPFMTKRIFYTAVTRAKKIVILVGQVQAIEKFLKNNRDKVRNSHLSEKICSKFAKQFKNP